MIITSHPPRRSFDEKTCKAALDKLFKAADNSDSADEIAIAAKELSDITAVADKQTKVLYFREKEYDIASAFNYKFAESQSIAKYLAMVIADLCVLDDPADPSISPFPTFNREVQHEFISAGVGWKLCEALGKYANEPAALLAISKALAYLNAKATDESQETMAQSDFLPLIKEKGDLFIKTSPAAAALLLLAAGGTATGRGNFNKQTKEEKFHQLFVSEFIAKTLAAAANSAEDEDIYNSLKGIETLLGASPQTAAYFNCNRDVQNNLQRVSTVPSLSQASQTMFEEIRKQFKQLDIKPSSSKISTSTSSSSPVLNAEQKQQQAVLEKIMQDQKKLVEQQKKQEREDRLQKEKEEKKKKDKEENEKLKKMSEEEKKKAAEEQLKKQKEEEELNKKFAEQEEQAKKEQEIAEERRRKQQEELSKKKKSQEEKKQKQEEEKKKQDAFKNNKSKVLEQLDILIKHTDKKSSNLQFNKKDNSSYYFDNTCCQHDKCGKEFGFFGGASRKHCHLCGQSFCESHAPEKPVEIRGTNEQTTTIRVCFKCRKQRLAEPTCEVYISSDRAAERHKELHSIIEQLNKKRVELVQSANDTMTSEEVDNFWKSVSALQKAVKQTAFAYMMEDILFKVNDHVHQPSDEDQITLNKIANLDPQDYDIDSFPGGKLIAEVADMLPAPFNAPLIVISGIFKLINMVVASRAACIDLGQRLASLTPVIVELNKRYQKDPNEFIVDIVRRLEGICYEAVELIKQFVPSREELKKDSITSNFCGWFKRVGAAIRHPAQRFENINNDLSQATQDFVFAKAALESGYEVKEQLPKDKIAEIIANETNAMKAELAKANEPLFKEIKNTLENFTKNLQKDLEEIKEMLRKSLEKQQEMHGDIKIIQTQMEQLQTLILKQQQHAPGSPGLELVGYKGEKLVIDESQIIGSGRRSIVYGIQGHPNKVAKCLRYNPGSSEQELATQAEDFVYEARLHMKQYTLTPNSVLRCYGLYSQVDSKGVQQSYIILDKGLCPSDDFADLLSKKASYNLPFVVRLYFAFVCAKELKAMHLSSNPTFFGDVRPNNILISTSGAPLLSDFGSARQESHLQSEKAKLQRIKDLQKQGKISSNTSRHISFATPAFSNYYAPETLSDPSALSSASDVFGFGVTLYELATGEKFVSSEKTLFVDAAACIKKLHGNEDVYDLIKKCVELQASHRLSIQDVFDLIETILEEEKVKAEVSDINTLLSEAAEKFKNMW